MRGLGRHRYLFGLLQPGGVRATSPMSLLGAWPRRPWRSSSGFASSSGCCATPRASSIGSRRSASSHGAGGRLRPGRADRARLRRRPRPAQAVPLRRLRRGRVRGADRAGGDGYARLRILFREAGQSAVIIREFDRAARGAGRRDRARPPGRRSPRSRPRSARRSIGCASTRTARCGAGGSRRRHSPTGTASTSPPRISPSRTSRSSWRASGCPTPSAIVRARHGNWVLRGLRAGIRAPAIRSRREPPGVSPGRPVTTRLGVHVQTALASRRSARRGALRSQGRRHHRATADASIVSVAAGRE